MKVIYADNVLSYIDRLLTCGLGKNKSLGYIRKFVENLPSVEPVRGEWKFGKNHGEFVEAECTSCKGLLLVKWYDEIDKYRYCPNCGARMDGEGYEID